MAPQILLSAAARHGYSRYRRRAFVASSLVDHVHERDLDPETPNMAQEYGIWAPTATLSAFGSSSSDRSSPVTLGSVDLAFAIGLF